MQKEGRRAAEPARWLDCVVRVAEDLQPQCQNALKALNRDTVLSKATKLVLSIWTVLVLHSKREGNKAL